MRLHHLIGTGALAAFCAAHAASPAPSPYAGQDSRTIKALAPEDVSALLSGKGAGFAKAAELNGYPGPAHVLELAEELRLTPPQRVQTEALFASMQAKAIALGRALVDGEQKLDGLFASKSATPDDVAARLADIGSLQAQLRGAHLEAHLAQVRILTPGQTAKYAQLRGYAAANAGGHGSRHRH